MTDKSLRSWHLLRSIPRYPRRKTPSELRQSLKDAGFDLTLRSIQRDLIALSSVWGISCDLEGVTNHWYWPPAAGLFDIPNMGGAEALVFMLAKQHLRDVLPYSQLSLLKPYFDRAEELIGKEHVPISRWYKRVRVIQQGPSLKIPDVPPTVIKEVHEALLHERKVSLTYKKRSETKAREYLLSPQALILRNGVVYLVATASDYQELLHFALHRASAATAVEERATKLQSFDLNTYLEAEKAFGYPRDKSATLRLRAKIAPFLVEYLSERPMAVDQQLHVDEAGRGEVTATVADTEDLRWWLLSFGSEIQVLGPAQLRREMKVKISEMLRGYS